MILVAGSANLDFVVRASHIPAPGETVLGRDFQTFPGGKGANQAIACARAGGVETAMLVALGDDAFAAPLEASLHAAGVRLHIVRAAGQPTGTAFICVADSAENAITVAPGANGSLQAAHLPALMGVTHLLMQLETPLETVVAYAQAARKQGVKVVLNAAPAQVLAPELLAAVDVLVVNEDELAVVAACQDGVDECLRRIDVQCVVVTLGARGCCARVRCDGRHRRDGGDGDAVDRHDGTQGDHGNGSGDDSDRSLGANNYRHGSGRANAVLIRRQAFAIEAVDTTAAGDTFCGVLVAALSRNVALPDALRHANAAGALACTRIGAQSSIPTQAEVHEFLNRQAASP